MTRILIIEDEISFSEALSFLLEKEGFQTEVAETGKAGIAAFNKSTFDLVLLDLMIPEISGIDVCRTIRTTSQIPIIMLTAKDSEVDKVVGLELGADDYVTKPYSSRELIARIRAVLRRGDFMDANDDGSAIEVGPVRMDTDRHIISVNGEQIALPLKEFELLEFLMRNAGRVLTRMQLIDRVWGSDYVGDTKTLDVHIKRLRAKIETDPANPEFIQTVRGMGYKMERN
jgi:two-component system response regulator RegX3